MIWKRPGAAMLFTIFFILFVIFLMPKVVQVGQLQARSDNLTQELQRLRVENKRLETELRLLREDPVYLEKVARHKFNKAKDGEIVYKVVHEGETKNQS